MKPGFSGVIDARQERWATRSKAIHSFKCSSGLYSDGCRIDLVFGDGSNESIVNIPPARFSALVAVLQSTRTAFWVHDDSSNTTWISRTQDVPG